MIDKATRELEATRKAVDNKEEKEVRPSVDADTGATLEPGVLRHASYSGMPVACRLVVFVTLLGVQLQCLRFVIILRGKRK